MITFNMLKRMQKRRGHFYCHKNISSDGEWMTIINQQFQERENMYLIPPLKHELSTNILVEE